MHLEFLCIDQRKEKAHWHLSLKNVEDGVERIMVQKIQFPQLSLLKTINQLKRELFQHQSINLKVTEE